MAARPAASDPLEKEMELARSAKAEEGTSCGCNCEGGAMGEGGRGAGGEGARVAVCRSEDDGEGTCGGGMEEVRVEGGGGLTGDPNGFLASWNSSAYLVDGSFFSSSFPSSSFTSSCSLPDFPTPSASPSPRSRPLAARSAAILLSAASANRR